MNIIENLKVQTEEENNKILNIYNFVMNNSQDIKYKSVYDKN